MHCDFIIIIIIIIVNKQSSSYSAGRPRATAYVTTFTWFNTNDPNLHRSDLGPRGSKDFLKRNQNK